MTATNKDNFIASNASGSLIARQYELNPSLRATVKTVIIGNAKQEIMINILSKIKIFLIKFDCFMVVIF